jgi:hypothetical protein
MSTRRAQSGAAPPLVLPDQPGYRVRKPNQAGDNSGDKIAENGRADAKRAIN